MTDEELELKIKKVVSGIKPSPKFFEQTMKIVTENKIHRYNNTKESVPSPYKLIKTFIMKKSLLIGVPFIALLIIAVMVSKKQPSEMSFKKVEESRLAVNDTQGEDLTSIDSIVASFNSEATAETTINTDESYEEQMLYSDLEDYNNLKTYTYEDTN